MHDVREDGALASIEQRVLELQQKLDQAVDERNHALTERDQAQGRITELEKEVQAIRAKLAFYEGPNAPRSRATLKAKPPPAEPQQPKKRGAPVGHPGANRDISTPEATIEVQAPTCPKCHHDAGPPVHVESKVITELEPARVRHTQ
ncbi:MAG: hypothetical protein ACYDDF_14730 [Thermoplasmatota archaeon]